MTGHAAAVHDGKIYVGGRYSTSSETYVYNGSQWTAGDALPEARRNSQFIEYNGELLCVGGTTPSINVADTVWKLTESGWTDHSTGYYGLTALGLAVLNDDLYSVGGYRYSPQNIVQRYNSTTGWQTLTDAVLPVGHESWQGITTFNNRIYVTGLGTSSATGAKVYYYDGTGSAGAQWHAAPDLPADMTSLHSTVVWNNRMYAIGGTHVFSLGASDSAWRVEPDLPASVYRGGAVVFDDTIYVIGGSPTGSSSNATNDVYALIPEPGTILLLIPGLSALIGWKRQRGGFRIKRMAADEHLLPGTPKTMRRQTFGFFSRLEKIDGRIQTLARAFSLPRLSSCGELLLYRFERADRHLHRVGNRISETINRTADRMWDWIV